MFLQRFVHTMILDIFFTVSSPMFIVNIFLAKVFMKQKGNLRLFPFAIHLISLKRTIIAEFDSSDEMMMTNRIYLVRFMITSACGFGLSQVPQCGLYKN